MQTSINHPHRNGNQRRWRLVRLGLGLSIAIVMLLNSPLGLSQMPSPVPLQVPKIAAAPSPSATDTAAEISTADIYLDGRKLFTIAAPNVRSQLSQDAGTPPARDRAQKIEATLNRIANSTIAPKDLTVTSTVDEQSRLPVITIGNDYLMTVTTLDAQLQGQTPEQRANDLAQTIKTALTTARQERQTGFLQKQGALAGQIVFGMLIASIIVMANQQQLKRQWQRLREHPQIDLNDAANTLNPTLTGTIATVQEQMNERRQRTLNDVKRRLLQLIQVGIWVGGSLVILGLFPYTRWVQTLILAGPLKVLGIALGTYIAIRVCDVLIDRFFSVLAKQEPLAPRTSQRAALRITTFSRVLRSVIAVFLVSVGVLSILSVVGVQLGPVLAGAGIVGLAISFASQSLIKDVINGLLILSEDQYAVGDVIQVEKVSGLVEYMNLRITQLRDAEGRLITIPNSAISIVQNLSKDWSRVDLAITIGYDANADRALSVIRQVGEDMMHESAWQSKIPEPPEVLGIDEISDAGITIRVWIKTVPLQQWVVAREFRRRLKLALDREHIAIGVPQQSLWFRSSLDLQRPQTAHEQRRQSARDGEAPSQTH